jgi:hypothetical protein
LGAFILALDPGPEKTAFVMWDGSRIWEKGIAENDALLSSLGTGWADEGTMAVEMIASYGMPVGKDVFNTCVWIGRFVQQTSIPWELVYRIDVKNHLCHSSRAKDSNVRQALIDRFGPPKGKKCPKCKGKGWTGRDHAECTQCSNFNGWAVKPGPLEGVVADEWAALGVAVLWWDTHGDHDERESAGQYSQAAGV